MSLLPPLLWSFLPSPLTHLLLPHLSSLLPAILPPSPRHTPTYAHNYRLVFTLVVLSYLAYALVADLAGPVDFYALLGVGRGADDDVLRRAFRTLSRTYHPDRAGPSAASASAAASGDAFIRLRRAYEILSDPTRRYAYDRFGPDVLGWEGTTVRELMHTGLLASAGFYLVSASFILLLSLLGAARGGAYWRNVLFVLLLALELQLLLAPSPFPLPSRTSVFGVASPPFAQIRLLHRLFTSSSIALSQLASVWAPAPAGPTQDAGFRQLAGAVRALELEAVQAFHGGVVPVLSGRDPAGMERAIKGEMEEVLVDRAVGSHPLVRGLWQDALARSSRSRPSPTVSTPPVRGERLYPTPAEPPGPREALELAQLIPLPPSPPLTPTGGSGSAQLPK